MLTLWRAILIAALVALIGLGLWEDNNHPLPMITFVAAGDVLLDRGIARKIKANGLDWPFEKVASELGAADIAFCNLECPLSDDGIKISKPICFRANPEYLQCVADAGFDVVSSGNNHALDCGRNGLVETLKHLDGAGIRCAGAGADLSAASAPVIMDVGGVKVALLARNMLFPEVIWYRTDVPTVAQLDESKIEQQIRDAKASADVVVVSVHWGVEYQKRSEDWQIALGRKMIDAGASLVLGHHSHCTQPVERYHGGVIAYSLGNFLFDSPQPVCKESMILKCRLSKEGVSDLEIVPVRVKGCRPVLQTGT